MAEIKTIYKGESVTLLFTFPEAYNMARLASHKIFVGETEFTGVVEEKAIKMQLKSSDTNRMIGTHRIVCWIDDTTLGLRKPYCGELVIAKTQASGSTASVSNISDIIIPIIISETAITVGDVLYNYVKGDKGDPFLYSDFTPEQLEALKVKGDPFLYSDFTPEQIAELQKPASDIATTVINAEQLRATAETNRNNAEGLRLSAEVIRNENEADRIEAEGLRASAETDRNTAEGQRQQAEINRQTNTATAIQNAETATDNANNAASLANAKADLANEKAELANDKAELAATAATQANAAMDGANSAAQSATNLVNSYATDLAAKELKANKQNNLTTDGTGTKFPTVDAVNAGLKAQTNLIAEYVHTSNLEISGFTVDTATGIFTKAGHGLVNGDMLYVCLNANTDTLFLKDITYSEFSQTSSMIHYVIEATTDTFKISKTLGGAVTTLTPIAGTDITKWHFEKRTTGGIGDSLTISNLSSLTTNVKNIKVVIAGSIKNNYVAGHLYFNINDSSGDTRYIYNPLSGASVLRATYTLQRADGFGTIEYEVTQDGYKRSIKKTHIMIKDKDLTPYIENQIFYRNINSNVFDYIGLTGLGFANGTSVRVYKY